jgi:hypothetical protein
MTAMNKQRQQVRRREQLEGTDSKFFAALGWHFLNLGEEK